MKNHTSIQAFESLMKNRQDSTSLVTSLRKLMEVDSASVSRNRRAPRKPGQPQAFGWTWW